MPVRADTERALSRMESGGVVRYLTNGDDGRAAFACRWDRIRVLQLEPEPGDVPEGYLLNHVVTLNLGAEVACDARFDGGGWQSHRTPHHGVGVYPALLPYAERTREPREYVFVEIAPDLVADALGTTAAELRPIVGARDAFSEHVVLALAEEARARAGASALEVESLGTALVAHLAERELRRCPLHQPGLPSQRLRRVLEHVEAHLDAPLALRTLAEVAGMDVYRFVRAFKQSTGSSPHHYVLEARITRAKALLADRALSITEVALQTGFATPSHFSVTFRRIVNATPRAYRDALR